jgi:hypothetical protein
MSTTSPEEQLRQERERLSDGDGNGRSISDRAAGGDAQVSRDEQRGLFDREIEDQPRLEDALRVREGKKQKKAQAAREFKAADDKAKVLIEELIGEMEVGEVVRVGSFKLSKSEISGGHRSFDVGDRTQLNISQIKE